MKDLVKRLRDELRTTTDAMNLSRINDYLGNDALIAETNAALSAVDQSREEWANQAYKLAVIWHHSYMRDDVTKARHDFQNFLRTVPETPVEPVAYCVYLPSMDTQEYFDDLDDLWCVELLTANPDAQVTPLYAQPKEAS